MQNAPEDQRVIAPSRFGYLGSSLPAEATAADQADAFVELLDHLGLHTVDVLGLSAGTSAAVQMALRHPGRVGHLVIMCGVFPGCPLAAAPPGWTRMLYSEPVMWLLNVLARPVTVSMAGVCGPPRGGGAATVGRRQELSTRAALTGEALHVRGGDAYAPPPIPKPPPVPIGPRVGASVCLPHRRHSR